MEVALAEISRQQRRREVREQAKAGARHIASGLPLRPPREAVLAAARAVAAKLGDADNARRAGEAAALAHTLFERSLALRPTSPRIACRKGCAHCCHQLVGAVPPEVFRIAHVITGGQRPGLDPEGVVSRGSPLRGLSAAARVGRKLACPLLVGGLCGVYAERPLVCRQTTSFDVGACIEELEGRDMDRRIEVSPAHLDHAGTASVVLVGAMLATGLPGTAYELSAALAVVLADPAAERRWLAGEDVFAGLAPVEPRASAIDAVARRVAELIVA